MTLRPSGGCGTEPVWIKSSYSASASASNDCVEVATTAGVVHVRGSKDIDGPQLAFATDTWHGFVSHATEH